MTMPTAVLDAIANLKYVIEKHAGAIATTEYAEAWKKLEDAISPSVEPSSSEVPGPEAA